MGINNNRFVGTFITPEDNEKIKEQLMIGPNGWLLFVACNQGLDLGIKVKKEYEKLLIKKESKFKEVPFAPEIEDETGKIGYLTKKFTDTETCQRFPTHVAGSNVFIFQNCHERLTGNTVNENVWQLLQLVRTLKVHGAKTINVVTPYHPYSRQEQATFMKREASLAKHYIDCLITSGANNAIFYHPHLYVIQSFYEPYMRAVALSGLDLFINIFEEIAEKKDKLTIAAVAPDTGASKFTIKYAEALNIKYAISVKYRPVQERSDLIGIVGDLNGVKTAIIPDDETITFTTLKNTAKSIVNEYSNIEEVYIVVSHMKLFEDKIPELIEANEKYKVKEIHITDSIPQTPKIRKLNFVKIHTLPERFAATINRLHYNQSSSILFYNPK